MNREEFYELLDSTPVHIPIYMEGKHGAGKSECTYQYTVSKNINYLCIILSQRTEGDFVGIPKFSKIDGKEYSCFVPPDLFAVVTKGKGILHLDEFSDAIPDIQNASQELVCARSLNGRKIGDDWRIVLSSNPSDTMAYRTNDIRPQLIGRCLKINFEISPEEWLEYAKKINVYGGIVSFITQYPEYLMPPDNLDFNKQYPSPREWKYLSDILMSNKKFLDDKRKLMQISTGCIGLDVAPAFIKFIEENYRLPKIEDIKRGTFDVKYIDEVPVLSALVRELALELTTSYSKDEFLNVRTFLRNSPKEIQACYLRTYLKNISKGKISDDKKLDNFFTNYHGIGPLFSEDEIMNIVNTHTSIEKEEEETPQNTSAKK